MQVFRAYMKIMKKQGVGILIYVFMFVAITVIITKYAFPNQIDIFTVKQVPIHVVNMDRDSEFVIGMLDYLTEYGTFVEIDNNEDARSDALFYGQVNYILTIPEDFTEQFMNGKEPKLRKQTDPSSAAAISLDSALNNYLNAASRFIKYQPDITVIDLIEQLKTTQVVETKVSFNKDQKGDAVLNREFNRFFYNYLGYVIIVCFIVGISMVMVIFHGVDIRRRNFASPITNGSYTRQMLMGNMVFALGFVTLFYIIGFVFNPYRTLDANLLLMWLNTMIYGGVAVSISYLIGICLKEKKAVQALSTMISLGMAFVSGMFVPQALLAKPMLRIGTFIPGYWYVKANNMIADLTSYSIEALSDILLAMVIQIGFTVALISIAMVVNKRKRQLAY